MVNEGTNVMSLKKEELIDFKIIISAKEVCFLTKQYCKMLDMDLKCKVEKQCVYGKN